MALVDEIDRADGRGAIAEAVHRDEFAVGMLLNGERHIERATVFFAVLLQMSEIVKFPAILGLARLFEQIGEQEIETAVADCAVERPADILVIEYIGQAPGEIPAAR